MLCFIVCLLYVYSEFDAMTFITFYYVSITFYCDLLRFITFYGCFVVTREFQLAVHGEGGSSCAIFELLAGAVII